MPFGLLSMKGITAAEPFALAPEASGACMASTSMSLSELFEAHGDFVYRSCRRLGLDEGAAEDATQHVFLVAAKKLAEIRRGSERAYLFGIAQHVVMNARRAIARRREDAETDAVDEAALPDALVDQARARRLADRVLDDMDLDLRTAFVLYELEQMTFTEIAELLDVPRGTVASRVRRAREDFETRVKRITGRAAR